MTIALEVLAALTVGYLIDRAGPLHGTTRRLYIDLLRVCWQNDWTVESVTPSEIRLRERRVG